MTLTAQKHGKSVFLVGMPTSGKSTLGAAVVKQLHELGTSCDFVDLDEAIEETCGKTVAQLFAESEQIFRLAESLTLKKLMTDLDNDLAPAVVACGGGVVESELNRQILKNKFCVYLECSLPHLVERALAQGERPLLTATLECRDITAGMKDQLAMILRRRAAFYKEVSDVTLRVGETSLNEDTFNLLKLILPYIRGGNE